MASFVNDYIFRTPLRTIEFKTGQETFDHEVIAAAELACALAKDITNASNGPAKGSTSRSTINLKG